MEATRQRSLQVDFAVAVQSCGFCSRAAGAYRLLPTPARHGDNCRRLPTSGAPVDTSRRRETTAGTELARVGLGRDPPFNSGPMRRRRCARADALAPHECAITWFSVLPSPVGHVLIAMTSRELAATLGRAQRRLPRVVHRRSAELLALDPDAVWGLPDADTPVRVLEGHVMRVQAVAFGPDGARSSRRHRCSCAMDVPRRAPNPRSQVPPRW